MVGFDPHRRRFLASGARLTVGTLALGACGGHDAGRYTEADIRLLAEQRVREVDRSGQGRFGVHRYRGYRGLAELPWFEVDSSGVLRCTDEGVPKAFDFHCHFGMSMLFEPELDLLAGGNRVRHLLDCDATEPGCDLDLDVYINGNFDAEALDDLQCTTIAQATWGNDIVRTHTLANLLAEMDATRVERAVILPVAFNFPFGDNLTEKWQAVIEVANASDRLLAGASVHLRDEDKIERLEAYAAAGARVVKLHPTVQGFYPDEPQAMEIYQAAERLGLVIFFHGGRAGIEPESRHGFAMPRHYEAAVASFPSVPFVMGHAGARDVDAMLELALRHENAWLGIHGQAISSLDEILRRTGGERVLFGTDWPFYHQAATLAKVLIVTDEPGRREAMRHAVLRGNAERLLGESPA